VSTRRTSRAACAFHAGLGVAVRRAEETIARLVQRADEALYPARADGRNRVEPASGRAGERASPPSRAAATAL
jgi:PleD family two-component response regulator